MTNEVRLGGSHMTKVFDEAGEPVTVIGHKVDFEHGGVQCYKITVAIPEPTTTEDDLTVISGLGAATERWLNGYGIRSFAALAGLADAAVANMATDEQGPQGVTPEKILAWRTAASAM